MLVSRRRVLLQLESLIIVIKHSITTTYREQVMKITEKAFIKIILLKILFIAAIATAVLHLAHQFRV